MAPETRPALLARIAKNGGSILVVGEGLSEQLGPSCREHPQINIWDDKLESLRSKVVPDNTHVIIYNKFVSHPTVHSLKEFARKRRAILFPMMSIREIKEALRHLTDPPKEEIETNVADRDSKESRSEAADRDSKESRSEAADRRFAEIQTEIHRKQAEGTETGSGNLSTTESVGIGLSSKTPETPKSGRTGRPQSATTKFITEHYDKSLNYSALGAKGQEARRLLELMNKEGLTSTFNSVQNLLGQYLLKQTSDRIIKRRFPPKEPIPIRPESKTPKSSTPWTADTTQPPPTTPPPTPPPAAAPTPIPVRLESAAPTPPPVVAPVTDDFAEAEKLLTDARAAIDLLLDFIPKLRNEMEILRKKQQKIRELLGGGD